MIKFDILTNACAVGCGVIMGLIAGQVAKSWLKSKKDEMDSENEGVFSDFAVGDTKLVLVVQNGLKMGKGKIAAQCSHASVIAYKQCSRKCPKILSNWSKGGQKKVVVKVENEDDLFEVANEARKAGLLVSLVCDAGHTQVPSGSRTVLGVGPGPEDVIDFVTGHLKLL